MNKRHMRFWALLMAAVLIFVTPEYALASSITQEDVNKITEDAETKKSDLEKQQDDAEDRKSDAEDALEDLEEDKAAAQSEYNSISSSITAVQAEIASTQAEVASTSEDIEALSAELEEIEATKQDVYEKLKKQIAYSYEQTCGQSYITLLLESGSITEFLNRAEYILSIQRYNTDLISEYTELQNTIASKSDELSAKQADMVSYQNTLTAKQDELDELLTAAGITLDDINGQIVDLNADIDAIDAEISGYAAQVAQIESTVAAAQAALAEQVAAQLAADKAAAEAAAAEQLRLAQEAEAAAAKAREDAYNKAAAAATSLEEANAQVTALTAARDAIAEEVAAGTKTQEDLDQANLDLEQAIVYRDELQAAKDAADKAAADAAAAEEEAKKNTENAQNAVDNPSTIASSAGRTYSASEYEVTLLGAIIQAEAGNQGYNGMLAVGSVIMNRVFYSGGGFPNTITGVVLQKNQFEPATRSMVVKQNGSYVQLDMTVLEYYQTYYSTAVSSEAKAAAQAVLSGTRYAYDGSTPMNQLFFMTPAAFSKQSWLSNRTIADKFTLGGHTFFNVL